MHRMMSDLSARSEEAHLHVRIIAGQDPRGVIVEDELAAELQVEPLVEALRALEDLGLLLALLFQIEMHFYQQALQRAK